MVDHQRSAGDRLAASNAIMLTCCSVHQITYAEVAFQPQFLIGSSHCTDFVRERKKRHAMLGQQFVPGRWCLERQRA